MADQPGQFGTGAHQLCGAKSKRSGLPCRNVSVIGNRRCYLHGGAPGTGQPSGPAHPRWKHGRRSKAAVEARKLRVASARALKKSGVWDVNSGGKDKRPKANRREEASDEGGRVTSDPTEFMVFDRDTLLKDG